MNLTDRQASSSFDDYNSPEYLKAENEIRLKLQDDLSMIILQLKKEFPDEHLKFEQSFGLGSSSSVTLKIHTNESDSKEELELVCIIRGPSITGFQTMNITGPLSTIQKTMMPEGVLEFCREVIRSWGFQAASQAVG